MAGNYRTTENFKGYTNKYDKTSVASNYLIAGSRNVVITDRGTIEPRGGLTVVGDKGTSRNPVISSDDWLRSSQGYINWRALADSFQILYDNTWTEIFSGSGWNRVRTAVFWETAENKDLLLIVKGDTDVVTWNGALATFASATTNTITLQGSETWAEKRFLITRDKKVMIGGTEYTYTGGETTTTLTGVTPDPTSGGHSVGDLIYQSPVTDSDTVSSSYNINLIYSLRNQIWYGSETDHNVFVSANDDYTNLTIPSPRTPGSPFDMILDAPPTGFVAKKDVMFISAGSSLWYQVAYQLSADTANETLEVTLLDSSVLSSAINQELIVPIKGNIAYVSQEPELDVLERIENLDTPDARPLSDIVKTDFDSYDFTGGFGILYSNIIFISLPEEALVLMYDLKERRWQPPQELAISSFSIINEKIVGHSSEADISYYILTGDSDDGSAINAVARLAYRHYGYRFDQKTVRKWGHTGYIQSGTIIGVNYYVDYGGATSIMPREINGNSLRAVYKPQEEDASIGKKSLGKRGLGTVFNSQSEIPKFINIHTLNIEDFVEISVEYTTSGIGKYWAILATGGDVKLAPRFDDYFQDTEEEI